MIYQFYIIIIQKLKSNQKQSVDMVQMVFSMRLLKQQLNNENTFRQMTLPKKKKNVIINELANNVRIFFINKKDRKILFNLSQIKENCKNRRVILSAKIV